MSLNSRGIVKTITSRGHAGFAKKGGDIVCSAVSILLQTAYLALYSIEKKRVTVYDNEYYSLTLDHYDRQNEGELRGITLFLRAGLEAIVRDYTNYINLTLDKEL